MAFWEIVLRLAAATIIGGVIGLNRDLHGKAAGVRTLGLVALSSALVVLAITDVMPSAASDPDPLSRVIQGVLTGIGFLGAGVILQDSEGGYRVHNLTTAAVTWLTACVGMVCGTGNWRLLVVALVLLFLLLVFGGRFERIFRDKMGRNDSAAQDGSWRAGRDFEPLTPRFEVWCSIQLSYRRSMPRSSRQQPVCPSA